MRLKRNLISILAALFLALFLCMPTAAQEVQPEATPEADAPVIVIDMPQTDDSTFYQQMLGSLVAIIAFLSALLAMSGVALWSSVPARVAMSIAVNAARLTPDKTDDEKLEKVVKDTGGTIDKSHDLWQVKPNTTTTVTQSEHIKTTQYIPPRDFSGGTTTISGGGSYTTFSGYTPPEGEPVG